MKSIITIFCLFFSFLIQAQKFEYKIKIKEINNLPEANSITDYMKDIFKTYPIFNDSTDYFEFKSDMNINKRGFEYYMIDEGKILLFFTRTDLTALKEEQ